MLRGIVGGCRTWALLAALLWTPGCFRYVYHDRGARPDFKLPIDENSPRSDIRWSLWWGQASVWKPVGCFYADGSTHYIHDESDPQCTRYFQICESGPGRTEVQLLAYSIPLAILTLGIAMPAEVTTYCSVSSAPSEASGPSGPE
jgi:hypothetical protein